MTKAEYLADIINTLLQSADAELLYDREADVIEIHVQLPSNVREPYKATVVEF